jgi:glucose-1-phosphate adenylyltransferase
VGGGVRRPSVLVLVMAGGAGSRLELLTAERAKPAVPFGGRFRLVDFPLSNCLHTGYQDVWVVQQYNPASLTDHLANGRPWDLDRTEGGLLVLHPHLGADGEGWHQGTADAVWRNAALIREFGPDVLLVVSADAVYRMDYADVVATHLDGGADVTMAVTTVDREDAGRYGVVEVGDGHRITAYAYKPDDPATDQVSIEVFAFAPERTLALLDELGAAAGEDGLEDFGDDLLPRLVDDGLALAHRFDGYWRDVGTVPAYWEAHQDLLGPSPRFDLDDRSRPLRTREAERPPVRLLSGATVADSLVANGATVAGTVQRSVLSPGVRVEAGAMVRDAIVLHDAVVQAGAVVERAVVDERATIGDKAQVGGESGDLTLIGRLTEVEPGERVRAGERRERQG